MTRIKICGLREPAHAVAAVEAGADFVGLVFAPARRQVSIEEARAVANAVREAAGGRTRIVGVFVDAPVQQVHETAARAGLDMAQLSGQEDERYMAEVRLPWIKAIHVAPGTGGEAARKALRTQVAAICAAGGLPLLDAKVPGHSGGTGRAFDWAAIKGLADQHRFLLAGGLTPDNVDRAVREVAPWGVDVSSGVETNGIKDAGRIRAFVKAVRMAAKTDAERHGG